MENRKEIKYFTFTGGYEGAVKIQRQWLRITRGWHELHERFPETQFHRIPTPNWAYDHNRWMALRFLKEA